MMLLGEPKPELSVVMENYLQAIYKLGERGERVVPTRLAEVMGVSVATAVGTMRRLTKQGLIAISAKKDVTLTHKGQEAGRSVIRRHRLAERMLTELLGLEWYLAHNEAHRWEHVISPYVEEKLAAALGYPQTNPYGSPIPGYFKDLASRPKTPLNKVSAGASALVEMVYDEDSRLLEFFDQIGLKPGVTINVLESASFKGTVTILIDQHEFVLGIDVARKIQVSQ